MKAVGFKKSDEQSVDSPFIDSSLVRMLVRRAIVGQDHTKIPISTPLEDT